MNIYTILVLFTVTIACVSAQCTPFDPEQFFAQIIENNSKLWEQITCLFQNGGFLESLQQIGQGAPGFGYLGLGNLGQGNSGQGCNSDLQQSQTQGSSDCE